MRHARPSIALWPGHNDFPVVRTALGLTNLELLAEGGNGTGPLKTVGYLRSMCRNVRLIVALATPGSFGACLVLKVFLGFSRHDQQGSRGAIVPQRQQIHFAP